MDDWIQCDIETKAQFNHLLPHHVKLIYTDIIIGLYCCFDFQTGNCVITTDSGILFRT